MFTNLSSKLVFQAPTDKRQPDSAPKRPARSAALDPHPEETSLNISFRHGTSRSASIPEMCLALKDVLEVTQFHLATSPTPHHGSIQVKLPIPACNRVKEFIAEAFQDPGMPQDVAVRTGQTDEHVLITWRGRGGWSLDDLARL